MAYLEFSPLVTSYEAQPGEEIYYMDDGSPHRYYPDLRAWLTDGSVIDIEVKPKQKLAAKATTEKYARIARMYADQGREFRLFTEDIYRKEPLKTNLKQIQRCTKLARRLDDLDARLAAFRTGLCWSLADAVRLAGSVEWIFALVGVGHLRINFHEVICSESKVWREDGGDDGAFLF